MLHTVTSAIREPPSKALEAIDAASPGDVIVVGCKGDARNIALCGGLMATASKVKWLEGTILDGGARDFAEIVEMGYQIFASSMVPTTSVGRSVVTSINMTVVCGGVEVRMGDIVVGDDDGIVVIPKERTKDVLNIAAEIDEIKRKETEELRKGSKLVETVKKFARV